MKHMSLARFIREELSQAEEEVEKVEKALTVRLQELTGTLTVAKTGKVILIRKAA